MIQSKMQISTFLGPLVFEYFFRLYKFAFTLVPLIIHLTIKKLGQMLMNIMELKLGSYNIFRREEYKRHVSEELFIVK